MVTNAERGREVRQRLMAAAMELVAERGWSAVSTRALAERAGVVPGVVHYHFPSVQALLREATVAAMHGLIQEFGGALDHAADAEGVLDLILQGLERYTGTDPMSLLFVETYLAATRDQALHDAVRGVLDAFRNELARTLAERGVAAPEATAAVLAAAIDGVMLHRALDPGLDAQAVAPVLRRTLVPTEAPPRAKRKGRQP
ncbi:TetR/AcrR family transcriptional regulator [Flindersiella endophytica]